MLRQSGKLFGDTHILINARRQLDVSEVKLVSYAARRLFLGINREIPTTDKPNTEAQHKSMMKFFGLKIWDSYSFPADTAASCL
jgi:hypothetical protein